MAAIAIASGRPWLPPVIDTSLSEYTTSSPVIA